MINKSPNSRFIQLPDSRNSGNRSRGTKAFFSLFIILLIRRQPRDLAPVGLLFQERHQFVHQGQFRLGARFPAQFQRLEQITELLAIKNHALEDAAPKGLQGVMVQSVAVGQGGDFVLSLLRLEGSVFVKYGVLSQVFTRFLAVAVLIVVITLVS